ncbi:MAG: SMI1/KNR4 family protein [Coriobacteriaceae bacterium]|nr:SMI1/KNR4 family protein [Coriobacteriaceae bacterium]
MRKLIELMETNPPATDEAIKEAEDELGMAFPREYREFMLESNGAEGRIGQNSYLAIWPVEEVAPLNKVAKVEEFTPGLVYFGSDGGGIAYAFDKRVVSLPIVKFHDELIHIEEAVKIADTFTGFLQYLYDYED